MCLAQVREVTLNICTYHKLRFNVIDLLVKRVLTRLLKFYNRYNRFEIRCIVSIGTVRYAAARRGDGLRTTPGL